jgi:hypothetical protein
LEVLEKGDAMGGWQTNALLTAGKRSDDSYADVGTLEVIQNFVTRKIIFPESDLDYHSKSKVCRILSCNIHATFSLRK